MKKTLLLVLFVTQFSFSQKKWFTTYTDSIALVKDANTITKSFTKDIKKISPKLQFEIKTVLNTTPYLIYFYKDSANIPLWEQVMVEQKQFFYELGETEVEGKRIFGLFFNGFYLPHELGHALEFTLLGQVEGSYESEYLANTIAILWWKKHHRDAELQQCYEAAKKMFAQLPNPVPEGSTIKDFIGKNYEEVSQNPYVYGYLQFRQFIEIYETKDLPDFDAFIQDLIKKKK